MRHHPCVRECSSGFGSSTRVSLLSPGGKRRELKSARAFCCVVVLSKTPFFGLRESL
jgi:hypothetical protein